MAMSVLARTWNANESGTLWERLWMLNDGRYEAKLVCSGVFTAPTAYKDEQAFWDAYLFDAQQYRGRILLVAEPEGGPDT